jgi:hypothetical protein
MTGHRLGLTPRGRDCDQQRLDYSLTRYERAAFVAISVLGTVSTVTQHVLFAVPLSLGILAPMLASLVPVALDSRRRVVRELARGGVFLVAVPAALLFAFAICAAAIEWMPLFVKLAYLVFFAGVGAMAAPNKRSQRLAILTSVSTILAFVVMLAFSTTLYREDAALRRAGWTRVWR